jgi:hypothetical protein
MQYNCCQLNITKLTLSLISTRKHPCPNKAKTMTPHPSKYNNSHWLNPCCVPLCPILTVYFGIHGAIAVFSNVFGNCSPRNRNYTGEAESVEQMARQTCQDSLPNIVVCFSFGRNSLPSNVSILKNLKKER